MKTPEQIITEIKTFISTSKPFRFAGPETIVLNLLTELENILFPSEAIIEEVVVEEPVVEEIVEEITTEYFDTPAEEPVVDEVIEETVTEEPVTKTTKKSKK